MQEDAEVDVVGGEADPVQRRDHQQHAQARIGEQRLDVGGARARRRLARAAQPQRRRERAAERQPHRERDQPIRRAAARGQQRADQHRGDDVPDRAPQPHPPVHRPGAHARDGQRVGQAAHRDGEHRVQRPARQDGGEAAREQHRHEAEPGAAHHDAQDARVTMRAVGQVRPRERHDHRQQRRHREHRRDLAPRQAQLAQVRGQERHVDADRLEREEVEDFDQR